MTLAAPDTPVARPALPFAEFVTLMALMMALTALSIDAMLPAMPEITEALAPGAPNRTALIIPAFVLGLGAGTLLMGPLSDSYGRRPVIGLGIGLYMAGALLAYVAQSLEVLLAARVLQGFGIAAPRVAGIALIRDMYAGRRMAQVMSFVMTIFILVPAAAPAMGQVVIAFAGWRSVFLAFVVVAAVAFGWLMLRQPETLPPDHRRPFSPPVVWAAVREVFANRRVVIYIVALSLGFGQMFGYLSASQQIYDLYFDRAASFPAWFAVTALIAGSSSLVNANIVMRFGMRRIASAAFTAQVVLSGTMVMAWGGGLIPPALAFGFFFAWSTALFFMAGLVFGNLNALSLEPLGHIAGLAAAVVGAVSTIGAVVVAVPIGLAFDGTPYPLMVGAFTCSAIATLLMRQTRDPALPQATN